MEKDEFQADDTFSARPEPHIVRDAPARDQDNTNVDREACQNLLAELSGPQREAAMAEDRTILLIAPAGTGKTKTLTARVAALFARGLSPARVLVCTYTNAAAAELADRLSPVLKIPVDDLWLGTTHAIGLRILRANAQKLGLSGADSIIDEEQAVQIVHRILREMGHHSVDSPDEQIMTRRCLRFIEEAKNRLVGPAEARELHDERELDWAAGVSDEEIEVYDRYERFKRLYDMIDYSDMLYLPTRLLEKDQEVRNQWRGKFEAILVDEYQDLSMSQIRMLRNLIDPNKTHFFAAADDDQCIYGWRGSDLKSTVRFEQYWAGARVMQLTDNYRTPKPIFDRASRLIQHVSDRHDKRIRTRPDPRAIVRVIEAPDPATEKQMIVEAMLDGMRHYNVRPERVAVLCRTNKLCNEMAAFLASQGIQVNMHEGLPLNTQPVSALVAWMQLSTRADNPIMFERMARYPERLISEGQVRDIEQRVQARNERAETDRIGPIAYMLDLSDRGKIPAGSTADSFVKKVREVREMLDPERRMTSPFARIGEHLGIRAAALTSERAEDHAYVRFVQLADEMVEQIGLGKTLASLTSLDFNAGRAGVNITTMHGAKGLEFDLVFTPGWEEGEFPSRRRENEGEIDDERRLAYVTITRARKMLVISWAMNRRGSARASRFISEMALQTAHERVAA